MRFPLGTLGCLAPLCRAAKVLYKRSFLPPPLEVARSFEILFYKYRYEIIFNFMSQLSFENMMLIVLRQQGGLSSCGSRHSDSGTQRKERRVEKGRGAKRLIYCGVVLYFQLLSYTDTHCKLTLQSSITKGKLTVKKISQSIMVIGYPEKTHSKDRRVRTAFY